MAGNQIAPITIATGKAVSLGSQTRYSLLPGPSVNESCRAHRRFPETSPNPCSARAAPCPILCRRHEFASRTGSAYGPLTLWFMPARISAAVSARWAHRLLWCANQWAPARCVPHPGRSSLVPRASAPRPAWADALEADAPGWSPRWLPAPHISHPWPEQRFDACARGKSPVRSATRWDLCGGVGQSASLPRPVATAIALQKPQH
jgi:hypothetical protein